MPRSAITTRACSGPRVRRRKNAKSVASAETVGSVDVVERAQSLEGVGTVGVVARADNVDSVTEQFRK